MYCSNCGNKNNNGEKFCRNCGILLETPNQQINNQNNNELNQKINKAVNPNMTKWAVLSVIIPIVGIIIYTFIGLSFYLAVAIATAGYSFAQMGQVGNPKLAKIGKVLNWILLGMAIVMLILQFTVLFNS